MINPILNKAVKYDKSLLFNGVDEYVLTTSRLSLNDYSLNGELTIHFAVKFVSTGSAERILALWDGSAALRRIEVQKTTGDRILLVVHDGTNQTTRSSSLVTSGVWYNVVITKATGFNNTDIKIFIDGSGDVGVGGVSSATTDYTLNNDRLYIGFWNGGYGNIYVPNVAIRPDKISDAMAIQLSRWKKKLNYHGLTDFQYVYRLNSGTSIANEGYEGNTNDVGGSLAMNFTNVDATNESTDAP